MSHTERNILKVRMDKGGECFLIDFSVAVVHSSKENRLALRTVYVVKVHVAKEIKDIYYRRIL